MNTLAKLRTEEISSPYIVTMLDHFQHEGPNGTHDGLVLEMLGEDVPNLLERRYDDERLPGNLAKIIAKQALTGLDFLHRNNITHGGQVPLHQQC